MSKKVIDKLNEAFLPENMECDGGACMGCWKDIVRQAIKMLQEPTVNTQPQDPVYLHFETIKITDHFDSPPIFHIDGLQIYNKAVSLFNKASGKIHNTLFTIDFAGIEITSFAFLNASIGKLRMENANIEFINASPFITAKIKKVIDNAALTAAKVEGLLCQSPGNCLNPRCSCPGNDWVGKPSAPAEETLSAQLRNQLSPLYGLAEMVTQLNERPEIKPLLVAQPQQAITNKAAIDALLIEIEKPATPEEILKALNVKTIEQALQKIELFSTWNRQDVKVIAELRKEIAILKNDIVTKQ